MYITSPSQCRRKLSKDFRYCYCWKIGSGSVIEIQVLNQSCIRKQSVSLLRDITDTPIILSGSIIWVASLCLHFHKVFTQLRNVRLQEPGGKSKSMFIFVSSSKYHPTSCQCFLWFTKFHPYGPYQISLPNWYRRCLRLEMTKSWKTLAFWFVWQCYDWQVCVPSTLQIGAPAASLSTPICQFEIQHGVQEFVGRVRSILYTRSSIRSAWTVEIRHLRPPQ